MIGNIPDAEELIEFIGELRRGGYDIGTEQYITAHRLLVALAAQGDSPLQPQRLETLLSPVLCSSREEQRTFPRYYQGWLSRQRRIFKPARPAEKRISTSHPTTDGPVKPAENPSALKLHWWGWAALICVGIVLIILVRFLLTAAPANPITARVLYFADQRPVANAQVSVGNNTANTDSQGVFSLPSLTTDPSAMLFILLPPGESNCNLTVILSSGSALEYQCANQGSPASNSFRVSWAAIYEALTSKRLYRVILVTTGVILFCVIAVWLLRFTRRMTLRKWRTAKRLRLDELTVKGASEQLARAFSLRQTAQEMRHYRPSAALDLDLTRTIDETIRKGMFSPAYVSRKSLPEYLVLIHRASYIDQQARLIDEMMGRLIRNHVYIERYFFHSDPRICQKDDPKTPFRTLKELAIRYPDHYLMVFSDGVGFFNPLTGHPHPWLAMFSAWTTRFLLTSEFQRGDYREWTLSEQGFQVLPSGKAGLTELNAILDGSPRHSAEIAADISALPPLLHGRQNRWFSSQPPAPDIVNELRLQLKAFLGDSGYFWLSACAYYPMLYLDLTIYLGVNLVGSDDLYEKFSSLVRLPWFRRGSMPDWLRARLLSDLTAEEEKSVHKAVNELLLSAVLRPDGFVLPLVREPKPNESGLVTSIWARLALKAGELWKRMLEEDIINSEPTDSKLRDDLFVRLMSGRKPSRLSLTLPEELRSVLYPPTESFMRSRTGWSAVALSVGLGIGVQVFLFFFSEPTKFITGTFINTVWMLINVVVFWRIMREETVPPQAATVRVFIGSVWKDEPQTAAIEAALERMHQTEFAGLEFSFGHNLNRDEALLKELERCDIYIGIFAGNHNSIFFEETYRRSRERAIPRFIYLQKDPLIASEKDKISDLSFFRDAHLVKEFDGIDELAAIVTANLRRWLFEEYLKPTIENALNQKLERAIVEPLVERIRNPDALGKKMLTLLRTRGYAFPGEAVLKIKNLTMRFGGLMAVSGLHMNVKRGEIYGLIGPNGAGKTTFLNLLTGIYVPTSGEIYFEDQRIDGMRPYEISSRGIARTFQNVRLFPGMSVLATVMMACHRHVRQNLFDAAVRSSRFERDELEQTEFCLELLEIFDLADVKDEIGTSLSLGKQRRLEIVRAMATRPRLLLLDEPAAGLTPSEQESLMLLIKLIRDRFGLTILLVERDLKVAMRVCERILVVENGRSIALGLPEQIKFDPKVIETYLAD